eukprot:1158655-Pelagomonas_calceolata.AAC.1
MSNPQGKSEGSTGVQTPRRLVGPERASIRMLDGSSRHFDRSSAEACEGGSPLCSGAAAGCPKFGLAEKVSQRLNEMSSISARPPTPIGSSEDAGAAMAHLAPTRSHGTLGNYVKLVVGNGVLGVKGRVNVAAK